MISEASPEDQLDPSEFQPEVTERDLYPRWLSHYMPHDPSPKQLAALMLDDFVELFYGGAAGGGKSDWLLMSALQYADIPGYSAIIFRKTFADLRLAGALISRSQEWLLSPSIPPELRPKWKAQQHEWLFPSGAKLAFGYLDHELVKHRYQGAEFQYVGFDELTQFYEEDYLYLRSRLRKPKCVEHKDSGFDPECKLCRMYQHIGKVPLRMRAASNPGGVGAIWVKERFGIQKIKNPVADRARALLFQKKIRPGDPRFEPEIYIGTNPHRPHIPAYAEDNPAIDAQEYGEGVLADLDPVTRAQLRLGDWGVSAEGRIRKEWFQRPHEHPKGFRDRYYSVIAHDIPVAKRSSQLNGTVTFDVDRSKVTSSSDGYVSLGRYGRGSTHRIRNCRVFATMDPAASVREGPGDGDIWRRAPSWTVVSTWLLTPDQNLVWWDVMRKQQEIPEILEDVREQFAIHGWDFIGVECDGLGIGVYQMLNKSGLPVRDLHTRSRDKLVRATHFINRAEQGKVWLPQPGLRGWLEALETELFTWSGHPQMQDDQVDSAAHAGTLAVEEGVYTSFSTPTKPRMLK